MKKVLVLAGMVILISTPLCYGVRLWDAYGGSLSSGALFLLLPPGVTPEPHDLPLDYEPLHKGHISLGVGLYVREDEDLIVPGTPPLILRRTYRSMDHVHRPFGIGTTHPGEAFVVGDSATFQWASVILADGVQIEFRRTSKGTSYRNAMFEHRTSPSEYYGARMGWIGHDWAMRLTDSSLSIFQGCGGPGIARPCGLLSERDADGHVVLYRRDRLGRLLRMEASADRWIAFDYDERHQVVHASSSQAEEMWYSYDRGGRLTSARSSDGTERWYTYSNRHEMLTIADTDMFVENVYDAAGRVIKQIDRFPDGDEPLIFDLKYETEGDRISTVELRRSDGGWRTLGYDRRGYVISETSGGRGWAPETVTYERDPDTSAAVAVTITCLDRLRVPLTHRRPVSGSAEWTLYDMRRTHCISSELRLPR